MEVEPLYSEAVLALEAKNHEESLGLLNRILKLKPSHIEALELKALILSRQGDSDQAKKVYENLISLKAPDESGPYHYQLAEIAYKKGDPAAAKTEFLKSIDLSFNPEVSAFYVGVILNAEGKPAEAEDYFKRAQRIESPELQMLSSYYSGVIHSKQGYNSIAVREMFEARALALDSSESALSKQVLAGADPSLKPYADSKFFASVAVLGKYDSNISLLPTSATSPDQVNGQSTGEIVTFGNFGWMTAPASNWQELLSYKVSYNKNLNSAAASSEYITNTASFYLNRRPLARFSYGLKLEGSYNFQNAVTPSTFQGYSATGELGPYLRRTLGKTGLLSCELIYRPMQYLTISDFSGHGLALRTSLKFDRSQGHWNPGVSLTLERNRTNADVFRYNAATFGFTDQAYLGESQVFALSAALGLLNYAEASPQRFDQNLSSRLSWTDYLSAHFSLLAETGFQLNYSNYSAYSFNEVTGSFGVGYSL